MGQKLFDVAKVGCYCASMVHTTEKRKDGETKVIQLSLRVDPFDAKLATAVDPAIRTTLFKLNHPDPQPHLKRVNFALGLPRQQLEVFTTPDTKGAKFLLDDVRIGEAYARTSNEKRGFTFTFTAIFGPASARELEACEAWRNTMAFVTFAEADYDEALDLDAGDDDDDDEAENQPRLPAPEFDTDPAGRPLVAAASPEPARRALHTHTPRGRAARKGLH